MKRFVCLILIAVLALSLSSTAFAATAVGASNFGASLLLGVYDSSDRKIAVIPTKDIWIVAPVNAEDLPPVKHEAFLKACKEELGKDDDTTRSLFWLDITGNYLEMKDFGYVRYPFRCHGSNVKLTVNGKEMEVVNIQGSSYYAKLTECGTVCISYS